MQLELQPPGDLPNATLSWPGGGAGCLLARDGTVSAGLTSPGRANPSANRDEQSQRVGPASDPTHTDPPPHWTHTAGAGTQ